MKASTSWRMWPIDLAGLGCCLLLAGAGYVVAFLPVVKSERQVAMLSDEIEQAELRSEQLLQRSRTLDQSLASVQSRLDESALELEPAERVNRRVDVLTRKATASGLSLDEVLPHEPETGALYRTVPIRITGTGGYPDVASFLHRLRTELRDTTVRSLQLVTDPETGTTFVFDLVWYAAPADRAG